jgi:hypothetical protein
VYNIQIKSGYRIKDYEEEMVNIKGKGKNIINVDVNYEKKWI